MLLNHSAGNTFAKAAPGFSPYWNQRMQWSKVFQGYPLFAGQKISVAYARLIL